MLSLSIVDHVKAASDGLKKFKKLLLKATKKLAGHGKYRRKVIMWFLILTARNESNPKATAWDGSEKFISVKFHVLKKAYVAKLYNGICRYFAKQIEIGLVYLAAERRILQYCFCQ